MGGDDEIERRRFNLEGGVDKIKRRQSDPEGDGDNIERRTIFLSLSAGNGNRRARGKKQCQT